jgi:tetratricopeptide (TPR) repeat protein
MIILLLIQLTITDAINAHHAGDRNEAYRIAFSISTDTTDFYRDEIIELRAMTAMHTRKFEKADSLFQIAMSSEFDSIRRKAYTNYAELQHMQMNFPARLMYLQKSYNIEPSQQLTRIIARHHFNIRADFETAETWIARHGAPEALKDSAGYELMVAEYNEALRRYSAASEHYRNAKAISKEAGLFDYQLFAGIGGYRTQKLAENDFKEKVKSLLEKLIFVIAIYFYVRYKTHERTDKPED